jgi:hypothetical protein
MANEAYLSGINLDELMVNTKAATVYAAQENSLYLSGGIVPMVNVPAGSLKAQVPVMGAVAATVISSEASTGVDLDSKVMTDAQNHISLNLHAARSVVRDLGGVSTAEIGRILGNAVAKSVDTTVTTAMGSLTEQEMLETGTAKGKITLEHIFEAVATIRGAGEGGELFGIVSTDSYADLMTAIGSTAFSGGDFQTAAMRNGFFGKIAGINCFVSSYLNNTQIAGTHNPKMAVFSGDAMRGAISGGVNVEVERRAAAVGFDVVASAAFGCATIDATRGVLIIDEA